DRINIKDISAIKDINDLEIKKMELEFTIDFYDQTYDYIKNNDDAKGLVIPFFINSSNSLFRLMNQLIEKYAEKSSLAYNAEPNSTRMTILNNEIATLKQILLENLSARKEKDLNDLNIIKNQINFINNQLLSIPQAEREYTIAYRDYKLQSSLYTELLSKKQAAEIAKASSIPNAKVLDYATPYRVYKVSPEPSSYYQKYVLLFLVLSIFIIVLIEFFNNKIIDKMDVSSITDVPILGSIPGNNKAATLVLLDQPKSVIAEAFRTLRTNIRYLSRKEEAKTILLTSTVSGEGKTFCSANLAAAYALQGKKTVLIGADLRKPKIHLDFKLQNKIGLSNYLIGKATIEAIT